MNARTPETDSKSACIFAELGPNNNWRFSAMCDFARKLELERNEARAKLATMTNIAEKARTRELEQLDELAALRRKVAAADRLAMLVRAGQPDCIREAITAWQEAKK